MHKNYYLQYLTLNSDEYILTKSEVSVKKTGKPHTQKSVKLDELDPYYEYVSYLPLYSSILFVVYLLGFLAAILYVIIGHVNIQAFQGIRMVWGILLLGYLGYNFSKNYTREWRFYYLFRPDIALSIKHTRKTKNTAMQLVTAIFNEIKKSEKSNKHIVMMLSKYGLLTEREHNLLTAKLLEDKPHQTNAKIINISEHLK